MHSDDGIVLVVGLGPPLQTMSLEVTSVIGCETLVQVFRSVADRKRTPSYEGTRTPSPTAPLFKETKMVWAVAEDAAAARTKDVENFMLTLVACSMLV